MVAECFAGFSRPTQRGKSVLGLLGPRRTGLFFLSGLPTTQPTCHCPRALAITSYPMAFHVPVVGTAAGRWPSLSIAKGPINIMLKVQTILHVIWPTR